METDVQCEACLQLWSDYSLSDRFLIVIDGKQRNLKNRKFCLQCSPFGQHNTRDLRKPRSGPMERFRRWQEKARAERKQSLVELLGGKCIVCGYHKCIDAIEFHHRDPLQKKFALSKGNLLKSWSLVLAEAQKGDLNCANCHRELEALLRLG